MESHALPKVELTAKRWNAVLAHRVLDEYSVPADWCRYPTAAAADAWTFGASEAFLFSRRHAPPLHQSPAPRTLTPPSRLRP
jgi:hypothetical protein